MSGFTSPPFKGLKLVETKVFSAVSSFELTNFPTNFDIFKVMLSLKLNSGDNVFLYSQFSTDGGSSYSSNSLDYEDEIQSRHSGNGTEGHVSANAGTYGYGRVNNSTSNWAIGGGTGEGMTSELLLNNMHSTDTYKRVGISTINFQNSSNIQRDDGSSIYKTLSAVDALSFVLSAGTMTGKAEVMGVMSNV